MSFTQLARHFLRNAAAAFVVWLVFLAALESLLPGFVAPYVDVADLWLVAGLLLTGIMLFTKPVARDGRRFVALLVLALASALTLFVAWTVDGGGRTLAIILAVFLAELIALGAVFVNEGEV